MKGPWEGDHPQTAGWRYSSSGNGHFAIDVAMPIGTPLYAIGKGRVVDSRTGVKGNGYGQSGAPSNWVILEFEAPDGPYKGKTLTAYYQHLDRTPVRRGDRVKRGDVIGFSGNTGNSSGPHLHLVVLKPGYIMTEGTRYAYMNDPDRMVVWPIKKAWGGTDYDKTIDVYVGKLREGVDNSASVAFLRKCLLKRGLLESATFTPDKPGNKFTSAVGDAVATWQHRHGYLPDATMGMKQAREFFKKNTKVRLHP